MDNFFHFLSTFHIFEVFAFFGFACAHADLFLHNFGEIVVFWVSKELDRAEIMKISSKNLILLGES